MSAVELLERLLPLIERALTLADKYIDRKYPEQEKVNVTSELWRQGDPLPEPQTKAEYEGFPADQPGRFTRAIEQARRDRSA